MTAVGKMCRHTSLTNVHYNIIEYTLNSFFLKGYFYDIMKATVEFCNSSDRSAHILCRPYENMLVTGIQPFSAGEFQ